MSEKQVKELLHWFGTRVGDYISNSSYPELYVELANKLCRMAKIEVGEFREVAEILEWEFLDTSDANRKDSESCMETDQSTNQPPTTDSPDAAGCPAPIYSALAAAIAGYMDDRNELMTQIPEVNLYYESGRKKREWMEQEIARIDEAITRLVSMEHSQNTQAQATQPAPINDEN